MKLISKPSEGEYVPYAIAYVSQLPDDGAVLKHMAGNRDYIIAMLQSLSDEELAYRYAPGKWNIKEVMVHVIDAERIFAYRALRIARNDKTPLSGYEQDDYVAASNASGRDMADILAEYEATRNASLALFHSFAEDDHLKTGIANDHPVSVRALAYQIAGHELHHVKIIKERYLANDVG
ncbi:MAG: DinB family protein [Sphingobacteriales bacterium]|nr:MAG: DinB family protein [Sphingobacteriales bacterium]